MNILFIESAEAYYMPINTKMPKRWAYLVEIATYVKNKNNNVKVMDCLNPEISHNEILEEISKNKYDIICFLMRIESVSSMIKLVPLVKKISPSSKLLTYGDAPCMFINFIKKKMGQLDAIVESGDWEVAITNYAKYLKKEDFLDDNIPGITIKKDGKWINATRCNGEKFVGWEFPNLDDDMIDRDLYLSLRNNEVTFSVSRGCPYNCKFCLAVKTFDKDDRRKNPKDIVKYMKDNKDKVKRFKLFSPTFTYNKDWVMELCKLIINEKLNVEWVCTSRPDCLRDKEMIEMMAKAGCSKIAVGIETLDEESNKELRKFASIEDYKNVVKNMFSYANGCNIEIKPLLMMGIKGQTKENIKETLDFLKENGAKDVRVAAYSPRQTLTKLDIENKLTLSKIEEMDKMTHIDILPKGMTKEMFLNMIYNTNNYKEILK